MPKILIFGLGNVFNEYVGRIDMNEVAGFSDNSIYRVRGMLYGKYCFPPDRIRECVFDYVVIFNQAQSREIHAQLVAQGIPQERIVSWQYYMFCMGGLGICDGPGIHDGPGSIAGGGVPALRAVPMSHSCLPHVAGFIRDKGIRSVLDVGGSLVANGLRRIEDLGGLAGITSLSDKASLWDRQVYLRTKPEPGSGRWDALVCLDYFLSHGPDDLLAFVSTLRGRVRHLVISSPFPYPSEFTAWADFDFSALGSVRSVSCRTVMLHFIDTAPAGELRLVTVTHKKCRLPGDPVFLPVFAGQGSGNPLGIQGDADGDNISWLNPKINELTALYWAWKNTDYPYLGLCHYRRYFSDGKEAPDPFASLMDAARMREILSGCDMIVSRPVEFWPETIRGQLALTVRKDALETGLSLVRGAIARVYPGYLPDFDEYMDGHWMYPCNMFVTSRPLLDRYCGWLFGIIIPAAEQFDASGYDGYSARIIGFIAERLLTLWILHNGMKVRELPVVQTEP